MQNISSALFCVSEQKVESWPFFAHGWMGSNTFKMIIVDVHGGMSLIATLLASVNSFHTLE